MKKNSNAQAPQVGIYQLIRVYYELHNGKSTPMADVIFKAPNWSNFDMETRKLRLRGLFNTSSIGPKEEFSGDKLTNLYLYMVEIIKMTSESNPKNPSKKLYTIEWNAFKPSNYEDLLQDDMECLCDLHEQNENDVKLGEFLINEMLADEIDEILADEMIQSLILDPEAEEDID